MLFTISLTQNKDFLRLYRKGKSVGNKACVVYFMANKLPFNRLGITTSKKVGNAVARNRARRIIRTAYQQNEIDFPIGYDIVIVAKDYATEVKSDYISAFFNKKVISEINKFKGQSDSQKFKKVK